MHATELYFADLATLASRIRSRELSPVDLTRAILGRVAALDGQLHSFVTVLPDRALAAAARAETEIAAGHYRGPLHGIPIGVKDLCATRGVRTTCASVVLADWVPDHDAAVVERLEAAGAVIVGKLNLTEFALAGYHPDLPIPRNPWNPNHHAGGSSSGSGVAVAAGLCIGAIGTDTGGSIRLPSSWNGTVGLKPTYGRVSRFGVFPLGMSLDHIGPMTRRVADAAAMLEALAGFDPRDPTSLRVPAPRCTADLGGGVRGLRLGIDDPYINDGCQPDVVDAIKRVAEVLRTQGADIVPVRLPPVDDVVYAWSPLCAAEALVAHRPTYPARAGDYGTMFRTFLEFGANLTAADYAAAHVQRIEFAGALQGVFEHADVLICPGSFGPAPPANVVDPYAPFSAELAAFMRYSAPFNFSGNPTLSVPCGFSPDGLPYGVQFVGRHLDEPTLCRVGHTYERATDWHTRHPSLPG